MVHQISCREAGYDCDFVIESENEDELVDFVRQHADRTHDMALSAADVKGLIQEDT